MNSVHSDSLQFLRSQLAAAWARGVRQCVVVGSRLRLREAFESSPENDLQMFTVDEHPASGSQDIFVPTQFVSETLSAALRKVDFDKRKASLFVWLYGAGYRTMEAVLASFGFIASLPKGSGVVFDYAVERSAEGSVTRTALDALASAVSTAGNLKYLIQPQAVAAMLRGLGFEQIVDLAQEEACVADGHLVSAVV